jgi:histidinol-phosphate aminotransferase
MANGSPTAGPIRLDRNENPHGPSPRVIAVLREAAGHVAHRYAGKQVELLQGRLSDLHGVAPEQIVLGCGSSEILRGAIDAFAGPQRKVVLGTPTLDLIGRFAEAAGADVAAVPLAANHAHDLDAMAAAADDRTGLVYVCNPNNPTASVTPRKALEAFVSRLPTTTHIVIDEAYHHYVGGSSDYGSFIERPLADPRLIVTRSFSAIYGLAGMRVGYAVASPEVARVLRSRCLPESLTSLAVRAAITALDDLDHIHASATTNANGRQEFFNQANARMLRGIDSHANFVMFNTQHDAADVVAHFSRQGILIAGPFPGFSQSVRVSLGTSDDMGQFWRVWDTRYGHAM